MPDLFDLTSMLTTFPTEIGSSTISFSRVSSLISSRSLRFFSGFKIPIVVVSISSGMYSISEKAVDDIVVKGMSVVDVYAWEV